MSKRSTKKTSKKATLSLDKFNNLLKRNKYILTSVYCVNRNIIRFAECRTPKHQKTFIVYIPPKYNMIWSEGKVEKRFDIVEEFEEEPNTQQLQYISDMKGPLLECDVLVVSSESLIMQEKNKIPQLFYIHYDKEEDGETEDDNNEQSVSDEEGDENHEDDEVLQLEKKANTVFEKVTGKKRKKKESTKDNESKEEKSEDKKETGKTDKDSQSKETEKTNKDDKKETDKNNESDEEGDSKKVELVFEDENGELVDDVTTKLEDIDSNEESDDDINDSEENFSDQEIDNSIPSDIEEGEVFIGIMYVLINISNFFKKTKEYEEEIIGCYKKLDNIEGENRSKKINEIKDICETFIIKSTDRIKGIEEEEKRIKEQLARVSVVMAQSNALLSKIEHDPDKYGNEVAKEVSSVYDKTRVTIHDFNIELAKLRDESNELLSNYKMALNEILGL